MATPAAGLVEARSFDSLLEGRKIVGLQISIIIICAVVAMVDGFDTQSIALAASTIAKDLGIPAAGFGAIFGIGLFGGLVGALIGGLLGDKLGRKPVLIVALVIVAVGLAPHPVHDDSVVPYAGSVSHRPRSWRGVAVRKSVDR